MTVRLVDAISKVKSWGRIAPQQINKALGFAQAHLAWETGFQVPVAGNVVKATCRTLPAGGPVR